MKEGLDKGLSTACKIFLTLLTMYLRIRINSRLAEAIERPEEDLSKI